MELVAWLRIHRPTLAGRMLLVTASMGRADLEQALARREVRVLFKPFNASGLIRAVERAYGAAV